MICEDDNDSYVIHDNDSYVEYKIGRDTWK